MDLVAIIRTVAVAATVVLTVLAMRTHHVLVVREVEKSPVP